MSAEVRDRDSSDRDACKAMGLLLGAHLDGQLDPVRTLEVEDHVGACEVCRERLALDRALRGSLKKAVKMAAPDDVRARMLAAMAGESARQTAPAAAAARGELPEAVGDSALDASAGSAAAAGRRPSMLRHWRTMLPIASAAALMMAWGAAGKQPVVHGMPDTMVSGGFGDELLRDFVAQHSHPVPPEQQDPTQVRRFEQYVGVPVRVPQLDGQKGGSARFVGGRLVPVHGGERAVALQYEMQQGNNVQRVTVFVYDPRKIQIGGSHLAARSVGTAEVRFGKTDGYSVAVREQGGVGYFMASDLDPESSANLVAVVDRERD